MTPTFLTTRIGSGTNNDPYRSALEDAYLQTAPPGTILGYPEGQKVTGRFAVQFVVGSAPAALLADPKYPQLAGYPYAFADYLLALRQAAALKAAQKFLPSIPPGVLKALAAAQQISDLDAIDHTRVPLPAVTIYNALAALSSSQKTNAWTWLTSGSPPVIAQDAGVNSGLIMTLWRRVVNETTLPAATVVDLKIQAAALYCFDNPAAFVTPSWDTTINVPGDQAG